MPRIEQTKEPESTICPCCPCCGEQMHVIGEDKSERVEKVPASFRVIAHHYRNARNDEGPQ